MVVAMAASAQGGNFSPEDGLEPLEDVPFQLKNPLGVSAHRLRQFFEAAAQEGKGLRGGTAHRLIDRPLIERRKWFWSKMRIGRGRCKRTVQLSGAPTQQLLRRQV